ncbi:2OG-Fe(II)-dependent halogenase WelO5 family protein [Streptomyces sp. TE5632]
MENAPEFVDDDVLRAPRLTRSALAEVFSGRVTMVQVAQVVAEKECRLAVDEITAAGTGEYDRKVVFPPIAKLGPAVNEFEAATALPAPYWEEAERADRFWRTTSWGGGLRSRVLAAVGEAWGAPVTRAPLQGRRLYAGMVREINHGTHVHFDDVLHECPELFRPLDLIGQAAMNVFLSVPERGGTTHVWRHRWQHGDEERRRGYGYEDDVVSKIAGATVAPGIGDVVLLGSRWFHKVDPSEGGRRITLSFCLGLTADGHIITWS